MKHLYGVFSPEQIKRTKKSLRTSIFFLLLYVDKETACNYPDVNIDKAFEKILYRLGGLNELLMCQQELVETMSLLVSARNEFNSDNFSFFVYKKLILDAGAEVEKLKECD